MRKVIIDCDPGQDDAMAILWACAHPDQLEVLAVGTVGGNNTLEDVTSNAQLVLQTIESTVELYKGCGTPLNQELPIQIEAHGNTGMDGLFHRPIPLYPIENNHAVLAYKKILEKNENVTIIALGPLTNIAMLLRLFPHLKDKIDSISLMGGGFDRGNVTPHAEFNIYADPEAADIVFKSQVKLLVSPLDVTEEAYLTLEDIETLQNKGKVSQFSYELLKFYNQSGRQFGFDVSAMHDSCAVAVLTHPELFEFEEYPVTISLLGQTRGMTCADRRKIKQSKTNVIAAIKVNQPKFAETMLEAISYYDQL